MARNSLGQFIVQESGNSVVSIKSDELYITKTQYDLFLLDNKEFTELTPTIDKDALINSLTNEITGLNNQINVFKTNLTQEQINSRGGCNVGIRISSSAAPNKTYNDKFYGESIGFDILSSPDGIYYNAIQTNGKSTYNVTDKGATLYKDAQSRGYYTLKATIKYRYRYVGLNTINQDNATTKIQFWKFTNGQSQGLGGPFGGVERVDNIAATYNPGDTTKSFTINLLDTNQGLGGETDLIYLPVLKMPDNFIMEILPGSTFTILPE